jgi:alkylation response protein AidB-like acyl-CoA dehydrogenase
MNFAYDADQKLLRETTRRFLEERQSLAALRPKLEADTTLDRAVWREGAQLGWTAMLAPPENDGGSVSAQPIVDVLAIAEELGRVLHPGPFLAANVIADALSRSGDEAQRKEWLAPLARGERVGAWCATGDGTPEASAIAAVATPSAGGLRLSGHARWVQDAHVADFLLVACRAPQGETLVVVPLPAAGVSVRVLKGLDLTRRFCEVTFTDAEVPAAARVGPPGAAGPTFARMQQLATVIQAGEAVGAMERLFELTVQYAKDRVQFGRAIGSFQAIKHRLADLAIELEGARAAVHYAALALADDLPDRDAAVATAGCYVREAASHLAGESLQIHGGVGFTWEYDVHLFLRRAKSDEGLYGDPSWHAERLCRQLEADAREA